MRSKMNIKGHPIHPMLVPFPIAFLTGAAVFDWLGRFYNSPAMWQTAGHLALAVTEVGPDLDAHRRTGRGARLRTVVLPVSTPLMFVLLFVLLVFAAALAFLHPVGLASPGRRCGECDPDQQAGDGGQESVRGFHGVSS